MVESANERQVRAAHPKRSTWLSANAGSGKTRVLTDRVARLLIDGVPPQNILCLTYTKAAAGEMQNRLFKRLGSWAMQPDVELRDELANIGVSDAGDADALARSRRLFARAIEAPGGLKIQTIHSFCSSILRQFPLEAGVTPQFSEIDERASRLLCRETIDAMAEGPDAGPVADLAAFFTGQEIDRFAQSVLSFAAAFDGAIASQDIRSWFGVDPAATRENVLAPIAREADLISAWLPYLQAGKKTDKDRADLLGRFATCSLCAEKFDILRQAILTQAGQIRASLMTKEVTAAAADLLPEIEELALRVIEFEDKLNSLATAERTEALYTFGTAFVAAYSNRKQALGVLDFDDLIEKTLALLSDHSAAQWVLYRLDGGIDHILVDEAQDTSPKQWAVVEKLTQEITSGLGARDDTERTIFVVGDQKQSIYSFQGADPMEFDRMRQHFKQRLVGQGDGLQDLKLVHSFRSAQVILDLVDKAFGADATPGVGAPPEHFAFFDKLPGRIDLWPVTQSEEKTDLPEWWDPRDLTTPRKATDILADQLATEMRRMVDEDWIPDKDGGFRPIEPGDILVLVRRRAFITDVLINALKRVGLDVAGADVIALTSDLAVRDVVAVLSFLATPADSLSLAAALRSPIFGLTEQDLFSLAYDRGEVTLWKALQRRKGEFSEAVEILDDLRAKADFLRPFELIERLLTRHDARRRLISRLGTEIEEALDVLTQQALSYEHNAVPSLTDFLTWLDSDEIKVKRQASAGGANIRVMTVHGAKGLESPIVFLPDTAKVTGNHADPISVLPNGQPFWRPKADQQPLVVQGAKAAEVAAEQEENDRLLYVALTRPKSWLIVCGVGEDKPDTASWYQTISDALGQLPTSPASTPLGLRLQAGNWPTPDSHARQSRSPNRPSLLPGWARNRAARPPDRKLTLSPSSFVSAATEVTPSEATADAEEALRHGRLLHLLLEHLPDHSRDNWDDVAADLVASGEDTASGAETTILLQEVQSVLSDPALQFLFAPGSLAEVDVTAALPEIEGRQMLGRIDRLVPVRGGWLAVDFKSNRVVPNDLSYVPEGIVLQMACYASALALIFPGQMISTAILWTSQPLLMSLPNDMVTSALQTYTTS